MVDRAEAVDELLRLADGRRVSLVMARQHLSDAQTSSPDEHTIRAITLIEEALERGSWHE